MATAFIGLGSNLGDRWMTLQSAVRRLRAEPGLRLIEASGCYETAPLDCPPGSGAFLNSAVAVETNRSPQDLLAFLHRVEVQFGRVRTETNAPRTLDLDLLLYDDLVLDTPDLKLPHPRMHERDFVLVPLAEVECNLGRAVVHPVLKKAINELLQPLLAVGSGPRLVVEAPNKSQDLAGMRALVTGSTSGIGLAIAGEFESRGATVITHGRRARAGAERFVAVDLREPAAADRLVNEAWDMFDGLDIVVLNAGTDTLTGEAAKWSFAEKLEALLAVDVNSTMRLARDFGLRMKECGRGSIITIGWDQAETGMDGDSGQLFAATKAAVMAFSRSLALTLAPEVRVNCIAPGWIRTAWGETASEYWQERVRRETPLGIWGLPEDVAAAAVWLSSSAAAFISGQTIRVNGGAVR